MSAEFPVLCPRCECKFRIKVPLYVPLPEVREASPEEADSLRIYNWMTPRMREVCGHLVNGLSNREIAGATHMKEQVVKNYLRMIYLEFNQHSRLELGIFIANRPTLRRLIAEVIEKRQKVGANS